MSRQPWCRGTRLRGRRKSGLFKLALFARRHPHGVACKTASITRLSGAFFEGMLCLSLTATVVKTILRIILQTCHYFDHDTDIRRGGVCALYLACHSYYNTNINITEVHRQQVLSMLVSRTDFQVNTIAYISLSLTLATDTLQLQFLAFDLIPRFRPENIDRRCSCTRLIRPGTPDRSKDYHVGHAHYLEHFVLITMIPCTSVM